MRNDPDIYCVKVMQFNGDRWIQRYRSPRPLTKGEAQIEKMHFQDQLGEYNYDLKVVIQYY